MNIAASDASAIAAASARSSAQLGSFVTKMGPALNGITRLRITLPRVKGADTQETAASTALTASLLPIAFACPHLQQLAITGRVGPSFLQAFGSFCPKLTSLHASLTNLATSTLERLPALLPHLASLSVLTAGPKEPIYARYHADQAASDAAVCVALRACPKLQRFDMTDYDMTAGVWAALPAGLLAFSSTCHEVGFSAGAVHPALPPAPVPVWQQHTGLRTLTLKPTSLDVDLQDLVLFLASAPNLSTVTLPKLVIAVRRKHSLAAELSLLQSRLSTGLVLTTQDYNPGNCTPLTLYLCVGGGPQMSSFITASIPPLPSVTKLQIHGQSQRVDGDLSQIPRIFPHLRHLGVINTDWSAGDVEGLAACQGLRYLETETCGGVTLKGLASLCASNRALRGVKCYGSRDISAEEGRCMAVKGWGGPDVKVSVVRGSELESEDRQRVSWGRPAPGRFQKKSRRFGSWW
ncbi:MAG: hypothetical protein WDW38_004846 [Sanguina aurantia]